VEVQERKTQWAEEDAVDVLLLMQSAKHPVENTEDVTEMELGQ